MSKPILWMIGGSIATCVLAIAIAGRELRPEIVFGMAAPLVSAIATWLAVERTQATAPERLTNVLITAFAIKVVFFGAFVAVALGVLGLRPLPFIASFTSYYVALHFSEAFLLKRRLAAEGRP